ncbi:MAG: glycoside hydrolase family 25 protein [Bifidobacterium sp.]|nr:glycoside hydrolase family 25 protein [Bifidobacterium sp.]
MTKKTHLAGSIAAGVAAALLGTLAVAPSAAWARDAPADGTAAATSSESSATAGTTVDAVANPKHMWDGDSADSDDNAGIDLQAASGSATWTTVDGMKTFQQGDGSAFAQPAMKVIDVSQWQGTVDWAKVKAAGVDGVILRLGYCDNLDPNFATNLAGVRKAGIPYGIYLYSYAPDAGWAKTEADFVVKQMNDYKLTDMSFPVYYDLEAWNSWTWNGATLSHPTTPSGYLPVVNTFFNTLKAGGYTNVRVYSYLSYLNNELNDSTIHAKAGWVAQYNTQCDYTFPNYSGQRGWQYSDSGTVNGISGSVDMNAFDKVVFTDTNFRTPHYSDIMWLNQYGITTGFSDGTYGGMRNVVRQDMAAFLRREAKKRGIYDAATWKPSASDWSRFTDVTTSTPHAEDILWLAHAGIAEGYTNADGGRSFGGMIPVYRQDMAAFIYRLANLAGKTSGVTSKSFTDVNSGTPHHAEIGWLGGSGIAEGYSNGNGTYRYEGMTTVYRQDMAAFIHRLDTRLDK